jgi:hypothetical protein
MKKGDIMKIPPFYPPLQKGGSGGVSTGNPLNEKIYIKIAEIKRIVSIENVKREFYSFKRDELIQFDHPLLKNIVLEIDTVCYEDGEQYIFNGSPVRLGSSFTFQNENYQISGVVVEMNRKS